MKVFRELTIEGEPGALDSWLNQIESTGSGIWSRDVQREAELQRVLPRPSYCFTYVGSDRLRAARLYLSPDKSRLRVTNIVPDGGQLSRDGYNAILADFHNRFVARRHDIAGVLSSDDRTLEEIVGNEAAALLKSYSHNANRAIPHPLDEERWRMFLIQVHREQRDVPTDLLRRWLVEEERWSEDWADRLIHDYELAEDLLQDYDRAS